MCDRSSAFRGIICAGLYSSSRHTTECSAGVSAGYAIEPNVGSGRGPDCDGGVCVCVLRLLRLQPQGSLDGLRNSALEKGLLKLLVQLVIMWCILYDVSPAAVWQVCGTGALLELGCGVGRVAQLSRMLAFESRLCDTALGCVSPLARSRSPRACCNDNRRWRSVYSSDEWRQRG